jgi:hypothetical protein
MEEVILRLEKSLGNQFTANLALLAYSTRNAKFVAALNELIELGLDGPDWEDRLGAMLQHHKMGDEAEDLLDRLEGQPMGDAVESFARGESQRGVARRIATSYLDSNSYDAAVQRARMWLLTTDTYEHRLLRLLIELPAGERRKGLEYARANRKIAEEQEILFKLGLAVICDVLKAHHGVDDKGLKTLVRERAPPQRTRSQKTRFGSG